MKQFVITLDDGTKELQAADSINELKAEFQQLGVDITNLIIEEYTNPNQLKTNENKSNEINKTNENKSNEINKTNKEDINKSGNIFKIMVGTEEVEAKIINNVIYTKQYKNLSRRDMIEKLNCEDFVYVEQDVFSILDWHPANSK